MVQAHENVIKKGAVFPDEELQLIDQLIAGDSVTITGELCLSLRAIYPIKAGARPVFVPLAHFGVEYSSQSHNAQQQSTIYVIGREHEPQQPKMAPFRLDAGPGSFGPIGQRPLAAN